MKNMFVVATVCVLGMAIQSGLAAPKPSKPAPKPAIDPARAAEIADMLAPAPSGLGRPITDRAHWDALARDKRLDGIVPLASRWLKEPLPAFPAERYLDYTRDGNRTRYQRAEGDRRGRLDRLVLAECMENKGRFLKDIHELIDSLCAEPTWVLPAHDGRLDNFKGKSISIDLWSSAMAWKLAEADYLLGPKLQDATRRTLRSAVERFVFEPFRQTLDGKARAAYWLNADHNWNAVCLANVIGAALTLSADRNDRARFVAAAEHYTLRFLSGFTPDGYCSEGVGYWNYGFGHYVLLSQTVRRATGGKLDLLARPQVRAPALFGHGIQIVPGLCPAFADCSVRSLPDAEILRHVSLRLGLGLVENETDLCVYDHSLIDPAMRIPLSDRKAASAPPAELGLRTWFGDIGVLIGRPAKGSTCRMAVALKGGHNAEHHNHNDVGSYVVAIDDRAVLLDPGAEEYTARTFSSRRYESKLLNSYGHPVPVVAGKLQTPGSKSRANLVRHDFTDAADTLVFDIASAYDVKELQSLTRTFGYARGGSGRLTVKDEVKFSSPQAFETALITRGTLKQLAPNRLRIEDEGKALMVEIDAGGKAFTVATDEIVEKASVRPTRIAITLAKPAAEATITVTIVPESAK
ncbi:MAG: Heparinase II/III-like protein [Planctomycetes bacterium ADurb.Bin126]|nr:MAG: Heparinase II/III-like protein [Planctomycetes bacterium ADurb.Bin126]HOD81922.1 heparinase II/III family protein [Phycisphaerae bacterium]HQL74137.1 heparinase II/III family protein [Phycisphaerae bacterium]